MSQEIIQLIKNKDEKGMRMLYSNYSDTLFGLAVSSLKNESYAEDALQTTFIKIWNNIDSYDDRKATLFTWMYQILRNTCTDIKRMKITRQSSVTSSIEANVTNNLGIKGNDNTLGQDVVKLLSSLDQKHALVLEYIYLRGYTQVEVADELSIPLGTVKTRVKQGMDALRSILINEKSLFIGFFILFIIYLLKL